MPERIIKPLKKIGTILSQEQHEIVNTALWLMIPSLLTKITGQLYNLVAASYYGTGVELGRLGFEHFIIANTIPELITTTLLVGSVGAVIIPILAGVKDKEDNKKFFKIYSSIINLAVLSFSAVSAILIIFGGVLFPFFLATFIKPVNPIAPNDITTIVNMMRVLLIPQLILGISVFISSGLNIYNRYILPQLSGLFFNVGRLLVIFIFVPLLDYSPWALVYGVIVGAILHLLIQLPLFIKLKIHYYPVLDFDNEYVKEIIKVGIPRMFALASDQIGIAFNKLLAGAFAGGISAFTYAMSLYQVIPALFGYTFSYASYPTVSRLYVQKEYKKLNAIIIKTINEIFFLALPFVVTIMVLRVPIVRLTYGIIPGTALTLTGTYQVAWILFWFSFGLIFITARWFVLNLFYAAKDTVTPLIITTFSLLGVVSLSYILTNFFSFNKDFSVSEIIPRLIDNIVSFRVFFTPENFDFGSTVSVFIEFMSSGDYPYLRAIVLTIIFTLLFIGYMELIRLMKDRIIKGFMYALFTGVCILFFVISSNLLVVEGLDNFLIRSDGRAAVGGISLAMSIVYTIEFFVLLFVFSRNKIPLGLKTMLRKITPMFISAAGMFCFIYLVYKTWTFLSYTAADAEFGITGSTTINLLILTIITVVPGFLLYYLLCFLFKVEELSILRRYLNPILKVGGLSIPKRVEKD